MKKALLIIASAALLFAGCTKEKSMVKSGDEGEMVEVSFAALLENSEAATKATWDGDGAGAKVNHWVMEVYDQQKDLFLRQEKNEEQGKLTQTFTFKLFKNQTYQLLFWADSLGAYDTDNLKEISTVGFIANNDARDAFSAEVTYVSAQSKTETITLYRPFGQLNIVTTDLKALKAQVVPGTYEAYAPTSIIVKAKIPTTFNVSTQKAGPASKEEIVLTTSGSYGDFSAGGALTTLFMDYIFASKGESDIVNFAFECNSARNKVEYNFTSIPIQRNYRTNIMGQLMSNDSEWNVVIDPTWETPDKGAVPVESVSLNKTATTLFLGTSETLTATVLPDSASVKTVTWSSSDTDVATVDEDGVVTAVAYGVAKITATAVDGLLTPSHGQQSASCTVTVDHNFVEMAGLKWATCNIGATTPTEAGWYFSWGNIDGYIFNDSKWVLASDGTTSGSFSLNAYKETTGYTLDGNITPDGGHDAARANWGLKWRMPSSAEFQKLYEACGDEGAEHTPEELLTDEPEKGIYWLTASQEYIAEYEGVAGVLFVDGNKTKLFFPVTGNGNETTSLKSPDTGRYWASTLNYPEPDNVRTAYKLYLTETNVYPQWATPQCYRGYVIRPVKSIE